MKFSCSLIWQVFFMHSKSRTTSKISILYNIFRQHIFCHLLKIWVDCHFFKLLLSFLIDGSQLVVHIPFFKKKKQLLLLKMTNNEWLWWHDKEFVMHQKVCTASFGDVSEILMKCFFFPGKKKPKWQSVIRHCYQV